MIDIKTKRVWELPPKSWRYEPVSLLYLNDAVWFASRVEALVYDHQAYITIATKWMRKTVLTPSTTWYKLLERFDTQRLDWKKCGF